MQQFVADRALLTEVGHECQVLAARKSSHRELEGQALLLRGDRAGTRWTVEPLVRYFVSWGPSSVPGPSLARLEGAATHHDY